MKRVNEVPPVNESLEQPSEEGEFNKCGCPSGIERKIYHITLFIIVFITPLLVLVYCYSRVYHEIQIVQKAVEQVGQSSKEDKKTRALVYIMLLVAAFMVCWGPWCIFQMAHSFGILVRNSVCDFMIESVKM